MAGGNMPPTILSCVTRRLMVLFPIIEEERANDDEQERKERLPKVKNFVFEGYFGK